MRHDYKLRLAGMFLTGMIAGMMLVLVLTQRSVVEGRQAMHELQQMTSYETATDSGKCDNITSYERGSIVCEIYLKDGAKWGN